MRWTPELDDDLKVFFENEYTDSEIADAMAIDDERVVTRRRLRLRLLRRDKRGGHWYWEEKEDKIIKENPHLTARQLAEKMGRPKCGVDYRRHTLQAKSKALQRWLPWQTEVLRKHYRDKGPKHVADETGMTKKQVVAKAWALQIKLRKKAEAT